MRATNEKERGDRLCELAGTEQVGQAWRATLEMSELDAHAVLSCLQLALRHPNLPPQVRSMVKAKAIELARQVCRVGPATAAIVAAGWNGTGVDQASIGVHGS